MYDNFILSRKLADLTDKTIQDYRLFIAPLIDFLGKETQVEEITQEQINKYLETIVDKPISKSSKATYIRHIKIFLKWLHKEVKVQYSYKSIRVPKSPKKRVKIYSDEEIKMILDKVVAENELLTIRNKCIIALMYDSGLRQSEVCNLQRKEFDLKNKRMCVHGKGNKDRVVPMGEFTRKLVEKYLDMCPYSSEYLLVNRHGDKLTCNAVKLLISKISKELPFELSSHKLRHNFATNYCIDQYEEKGQVDIFRLSTLLGHEEVETTKRYLHMANEIICTRESVSHLDRIGV